MTDDIVTRLRGYNPKQQEVDLARLHFEAADEIKCLRADVRDLQKIIAYLKASDNV